MPKTAIKQNFELQTRGIAKVDAEISIMVDGREIPTAAVLGAALEHAIASIREDITNSYRVVPERV